MNFIIIKFITNTHIKDEISEEKIITSILLFLNISILIIFNCLCICVGLCTATFVPMKARRQQIPWNWSYREFWATNVDAENWSGPLPEQWVLVTTKPCLSSHIFIRVHIGIMGEKYKKNQCEVSASYNFVYMWLCWLKSPLLLFFPLWKTCFHWDCLCV